MQTTENEDSMLLFESLVLLFWGYYVRVWFSIVLRVSTFLKNNKRMLRWWEYVNSWSYGRLSYSWLLQTKGSKKVINCEMDKTVFESSFIKGYNKILAVKNNMIRTNHVMFICSTVFQFIEL